MRRYHDIHTVGVLQERLRHQCGVVAEFLLEHPKTVVVKSFKIFIRLAYMYTTSPQLFALSVAVPVPVNLIVCRVGQRRVLQLERKIHKTRELAVSGTIDVLQQHTTVRQFVMEDFEHDKYALTNVFRRMLEQRLDVLKQLTGYLIETCYTGMHLVLNYVGISLCLTGAISPGTVFTFGIYNREMASEILIMSDLVPNLMSAVALPLGLLCAVLGSVPKIEPVPNTTPGLAQGRGQQDQQDQIAGELRPAQFQGHIVFKGVEFRYPTELQKPVLRGLSFEVKPGHKVALVGQTGCGKSTIVNLVQRLYDVDTGQILLDGEPISSYDVHHLRRHMGVVSQDTVLFSSSIKENITYGMGQGNLPMPTDEDVWKVS